MINRKFINFKTYNGFLAKKNEIPEDSIVFIQDKPCIWARGKEYICDGPSTASVESNTLTFKNGNDKMIFKFQQKDGTITIEDSEGNKSSATYVLNDIYEGDITNIYNAITNINLVAEGYVLSEELANVAFSGSYNDLINKPIQISVDAQLDSLSENPVLNKAIYKKLLDKLDVGALDGYVTTGTYESGMATKLEKLIADYGISIFRDSNSLKLKIKTTLDTSVYVIVESLPDVSEADPNKIYLLETQNFDGTYRYELYRVRNGQWISFDMVVPVLDLSPYELKEDALADHEAIWNAINSIDLTPYAKVVDDINPIWSNFLNYALKDYVDNNFQRSGDYATKNWVETYFVLKILVYTPKQGEWGTNDTSGEESQPQTPIIQQTITVDRELSLSSPNPVENATVTTAIFDLRDNKADKSTLSTYAKKSDLDSKANASDLSNYVTNNVFGTALDGKLDLLTAGNGISIINNVISSTLDTSVYVFVDELPSTNINNDKIYIVENISGGERTYTLYRHIGNDWVLIGSVAPDIDLTPYLRSEDAASTYLTISDATSTYLPKRNDYALTSNIADLKDYVDSTFQLAGEYALASDIPVLKLYLDNKISKYALSTDVAAAIANLQSDIEDNYVQKKDVYNPTVTDWSENESSQPSQGGSSEGQQGGQSGYVVHNMITLTTTEYEDLASRNLIEENVYYFTYEEEETSNWGFGDQFPVILTDGSTPDSIGTFPINLV